MEQASLAFIVIFKLVFDYSINKIIDELVRAIVRGILIRGIKYSKMSKISHGASLRQSAKFT